MDILSAIWTVTYGVLLIILGFNALIIVHEFGHFIVARLCGVRCEKFYIWFDFWGLRFFRFKWGDTEYGLGLFPLGGYVKMLGQEDDPGALRAEIERAKMQAESPHPSPPPEGEGTLVAPPPKGEGTLPPSIFAPDSYLSKSVPQRLAIIVAGVIMNFLFAIVCAAGAYMIGVKEATPAVGNVIPGSPAWQAGLQSGDRITAIDGKPAKTFQDVIGKMVGRSKNVQLTIDRKNEPLTIDVAPRKRKCDLARNIGVASLPILEIFKDEKHFPCAVYPAWEKYYSAESLTALKKYSETETIRIEKVNGQVVNNYAEYQEAQLAKMGQVMTCTINGTDMTIPAIPMRAIPVRFKMGAIAAVLPGSDAEKQGIKADDTIVAVDGDADIDPLKLPQTLLQKVNDGHKTVELTVKKIDGTGSTLTVALAPIRILPELSAASMRDPLGSNALGLAWNIEPTITAVDDSRFKSGLPVPAIGDQLTGVEFVNCEHVFIRNTSFCKNDKDGFFISGIGDRVDIPFIFAFLLQEAKPLNLDKDGQDKNTNEKILSVRLTLKSPDGTAKVVPLPVLEADNWFNADRGFVLKPDETIFKAAFNAAGLGEALSMGTDRMLYYSGLVYRSLDALINGRVSTRALSGPVGIVMILYDFAQSGWSRYLMLLCLIGANLAVINMLPIPPLDGGHVVFLTYEGIFRRPPNELIQVVLSYFGLFLIILLMVWTVTIDFGCIPRI